MRVLLPWTELQDAMAVRLDASLTGTALAGKIYNYVQQDTQYPYLFLGEFESEDISDKGLASLVTYARVEVYSGEAGNRECQTLTKAAFSCLTATPLVLGGTEQRIIGAGQMRDSPTLNQEFDGVGVVWVGRFRVAFLTQQIAA